MIYAVTKSLSVSVQAYTHTTISIPIQFQSELHFLSACEDNSLILWKVFYLKKTLIDQ